MITTQHLNSAEPAIGGKIKIRQRASRACLNCRLLRIKCELIDVSKGSGSGCKRCKEEEKDCVYVSSKRGGQRNRKPKLKQNLDSIGEAPAININNIASQNTLNIPEAQSLPTTTPVLPLSTGLPHAKTDALKPAQPLEGARRESEDISFRSIQNPSDSLNLLARAASYSSPEDQSTEKNKANSSTGSSPIESLKLTRTNTNDIIHGQRSSISSLKSNEPSDSSGSYKERLSKFCLVEAGILTPLTLKSLISMYFTRHHQYLPIMPTHKVLRTDAELCVFIEEEPILAVCFVVIASRFENDKVHTASWKFMADNIIQELVLGLRKPTLGAIEALLTLSENVPKCEQINDKDLYDFEERFSWHIVGQAVRMSYYLGLDQKTLLETSETMSAETHRMRYIWTFCHCEERQTSIRFGKAFWSRGPTLCFPGYVSSLPNPESLNNFRTLIPSSNTSEDYSLYTEALLENTKLLSNIHELLYPSRDRTISLVHLGDYHKILDELTMGFATYRIIWEKKSWDTLSLQETVWISFNYSKLYAYGFAFEAHMKRMSDSTTEKLDSQSMFPMSLSATSDAKFIIEAKNAAIAILTSCVDNLHSFGDMAYLPARYYGYFGHAAVFLIKLIFTEAVNYSEQRGMLELIRRSIACFCDEIKGLDRYHPLIRCAQQLRTLLQTLWTSRSSENGSNSDSDTEESNYTHVKPPHSMATDSLTDDIFTLVEDFSFDKFLSPDLIRETAEAAVQDLTTSFSNDLNSDFWLSYFN